MMALGIKFPLQLLVKLTPVISKKQERPMVESHVIKYSLQNHFDLQPKTKEQKATKVNTTSHKQSQTR